VEQREAARNRPGSRLTLPAAAAPTIDLIRHDLPPCGSRSAAGRPVYPKE
jgi:hypothetical protein